MGTVEIPGIAIELGVKALESVAPKGIKWAQKWMIARDLLVLGPQGAGKTCFVDYMRFGTLEPEAPTAPTFQVDKIRKVTSLAFVSGVKSALELNVKSITDTPGHLPPESQAELASKIAPHILLLIADLTSKNTYKWLKSFLKTYRSKLMRRGKPERRLQCIAIAMNKTDKEAKKRLEMRKNQFRNLVDRELNDVFDPVFIRDIPILPCVAVATKYGTSYIDQMIFSIAKRIKKSR